MARCGGEVGAEEGDAEVEAAEDEQDGHRHGCDRQRAPELRAEAGGYHSAKILGGDQEGEGPDAEAGHEDGGLRCGGAGEGGGECEIDHTAGQQAVGHPQEEEGTGGRGLP